MKNPLSTEAFLDWVKRQPRDKEYDFGDIHRCPVAQYGDFIGIEGYWWDTRLGPMHDRIEHDYLQKYPRTFGALADRLCHDLTS